MKPCLGGIYFLIKDGECVYVGQSNDIYRRISEHRTGTPKSRGAPKDFDSWEFIEEYSQERKDQLEYLLIRMINPKLNKDPHMWATTYQLEDSLNTMAECVGQAENTLNFVKRFNRLEEELKQRKICEKLSELFKKGDI